jgi:methyl-accepting chemotaxis protein
MTSSDQADADASSSSSGFVRLRTFILVAVPLAIPIVFTVFFLPSKQVDSLSTNSAQSAKTLTSILAVNAIAPLQFDDEKGLKAVLSSVQIDRDIVYTLATAPDGKKLSEYGNASAVSKRPPGVTADADGRYEWEDDGWMHVDAPIIKDGQTIGHLQAGFSTRRISEAGSAFRWMAVALSVVVLIFAAAMAFLLGRSFSRLFEQLRSSILQTARSVDSVVGRLAAVTAQQTAAAGEESSALHETNATASEVGHAATAAAQRAVELTASGLRAEQASAAGLDAVAMASQGMRDVREQMSTIATAILALSERAAAIGDIASTVALLAERSNLLALNAAIEAARAGAQGRGFSVVAQEMRSLADGSNRSASQVKVIIGEIQGAIGRAVGDAREGERRVQSAEELAKRAGESIHKFADVTGEFNKVGQEIATSASQQNSSIEQMVESISHATQAGSTQLETTRQVEETSRQLRQLSRELLKVVLGRNSEDHRSEPELRSGPRSDRD